jgi:membrane protein required for beta-lactamase induction
MVYDWYAYYLGMGVIVYLIQAVLNLNSFSGAKFIHILDGIIFGLLFWPFVILIWVCCYGTGGRVIGGQIDDIDWPSL